MFESQSCGAAARSAQRSRGGRHRLVDDDRILRSSAASEAPSASDVIAPVAALGGGSVGGRGRGRAARRPPRPRLERADQILLGAGEDMANSVGRRQQARLVGIAKNATGISSDEDDLLEPARTLTADRRHRAPVRQTPGASALVRALEPWAISLAPVWRRFGRRDRALPAQRPAVTSTGTVRPSAMPAPPRRPPRTTPGAAAPPAALSTGPYPRSMRVRRQDQHFAFAPAGCALRRSPRNHGRHEAHRARS